MEVSTKKRKIVSNSTNNIDLMGGSKGELQDLTNRLTDRATVYLYGMEVGTEK